jgi:hypothetical protein
MATPDAKPCPFCGGINICTEGYHLFCFSCGADGPDADDDSDEARLAAWNQRSNAGVKGGANG